MPASPRMRSDTREKPRPVGIAFLKETTGTHFGEDDVVLLQQEKLIIEYFRRTRIQIMDNHFPIHLTHHANTVATGIQIQTAHHGQSLQESTAFFRDIQHLTRLRTQIKHLEIQESNHNIGVTEIAVVFQFGGNLILELQTCQACHMYLAQHGKLYIAIDVHQIAQLIT